MDCSVHHGHRERLDKKAKEVGLEFLPPHEQLEKILFVAIPRGNTNEIAHTLLERFGTLYGVLSAEVNELVEVPGVGKRVAEYLHDLPTVLGIVERCEWQDSSNTNSVYLNTIKECGEYAASLFHGATSEKFYMISLNAKNKVLRFDKLSEGTIDETQIYIRNIVKTALVNDAYAVILAHNHPSGRVQPSLADIERTNSIISALSVSGVHVYDHIIVSGDSWTSMRESGII